MTALDLLGVPNPRYAALPTRCSCGRAVANPDHWCAVGERLLCFSCYRLLVAREDARRSGMAVRATLQVMATTERDDHPGHLLTKARMSAPMCPCGCRRRFVVNGRAYCGTGAAEVVGQASAKAAAIAERLAELGEGAS